MEQQKPSCRLFSRLTCLASLLLSALLFSACVSAHDQPLIITSIPQQTATPTRPPWCKPLPTEPPDLGTRTATPNALTPYATPLTPFPTSTPAATPHIIDLAPYLPFEDKLEAWVFRCNGDEDLVLVDPKDDPYQVIPLEAGDVILGIAPPASLMGHHVPTLMPSPTYPSSTPITNPYPFGTPYPIDTPSPSPNPYP